MNALCRVYKYIHIIVTANSVAVFLTGLVRSCSIMTKYYKFTSSSTPLSLSLTLSPATAAPLSSSSNMIPNTSTETCMK